MQKRNLIRLLIIAIGVLILIAGGAVGGIQSPSYDPNALGVCMIIAGFIITATGVFISNDKLN
jgi:hypothetical protein